MQRNSKLLIYVENPYNIHLVKPRRAYHGFGLKNVEKVVDKYGGLIDRNSENGLYKVRIIIP
jgi:nitrogen-specific signal transduction histidine kinase